MRLIGGLALTFGLGLTFLLIQAREYTRIGFGPSDLDFGSTFYGLTGLHGAHVFIGLNLLLYALIRAIRGHYGLPPHDHLGVEVPGIYWHFVDVMWIVVYVTVYVLREAAVKNPFRTEAEASSFVIVCVPCSALWRWGVLGGPWVALSVFLALAPWRRLPAST